MSANIEQFVNLVESESVKAITKFTVERIGDFFRQRVNLTSKENPEDRISRYIKRVTHWAATYTFLGLGIPRDSNKDTIGLRFNATPRRYRGKRSAAADVFLESELLNSQQPILILGEPGAGKTTTLRRLALALLTQAPTSKADIFQLPIILSLREVANDRFICEELADIFGISHEKILRPRKPSEAEPMGTDRLGRSDFDIRSGGDHIEEPIAELLNATNALVLIDGLDELPSFRRANVEREIESLASLLEDSSVVVSCRSGDFLSSMHGFRVVELEPLDQRELNEIAKLWIQDPTSFFETLEKTPYKDIVDRPLLLIFLLFLFKTEGQLPEQPSLIYRKVVYRLLKEWDEERRIKRTSKYAYFDPDRKVDFLSELAYELTYEVRGKVFTEASFLDVYKRIHSSYRLPPDEHRQVASEIQTHTGIVFSSGIDSFEFSHLSIQEFLCANYIVRTPIPNLLKQYLAEYPAPVAVACALSSNPGSFFAETLIRHVADKFRNIEDPLHAESDTEQLSFDFFGIDTVPALTSFLSRLQTENPYFRADRRFGEAVLCLFAFYFRRYTSGVDTLMSNFLLISGVDESLRLALSGMRDFAPATLTKKTIVFSIDGWFKSIYEDVRGPWVPNAQRQKRLPLALLPYDFVVRLLPAGTKIGDLSSSLRERVEMTLALSPFCHNDRGSHTYDKETERCKVCGFHTKKPRLKKTGRSRPR